MRAARSRERRDPPLAERLLLLAARLEPEPGEATPALVALRRARGDRLGALAAARRASGRFPLSSDTWYLLAECEEGAFRLREAADAYARALDLRERADAALRIGLLRRREGRHAEAAAMFARAFAGGAGPDALYENARSLWQAGDTDEAQRALGMWGTNFVDGAERVAEARRRLEAGRDP